MKTRRRTINGAVPKTLLTRGFTLIEVLVALGIFGIAALSLIHIQSESVRASIALRDRTLATVIAENVLVERFGSNLESYQGRSTGIVEMAGESWTWSLDVAPTANPVIQRIDVEVSTQGDPTILSSVSSFRGVE